MKRIGLFILTNILVIATVTIITNVLGLEPYMQANGLNYQALLIFCLVWGIAGSFVSLQMSRWMAKQFMGVQLVEVNGPYRDLVQKVHLLSRRAGIEKMPEVGIYQSADVNAFATGPRKNASLVAVSTGLLQQMNDDEIEGVLAHEVAHIANGDMVTMALVQGVVNAFVMFFARVIAFAIDQALRSNDDERGGGLGYFGHYIAVMVLQVVFGLLSYPIIAGFSRYREYRADSGGAELAGKHKMIAALSALERIFEQPQVAMAQAKENDQFAAFKISGRSKWSELVSTHPPLKKRIQALNRSTVS